MNFSSDTVEQYSNKVEDYLKYLIYYTVVKPEELENYLKTAKGDSQNYQKFVVLAHQRSGSSMLMQTLRQHPGIVSYGELFAPRQVGLSIGNGVLHSPRLLALRNKYPKDFLEKYIFSSYSLNISAAGFKLFPEHITNKRFDHLWGWLKENKDIKIIYLSRQDFLATYSSLLLAKKDKRWGIDNELDRAKDTIKINPQKCLAEFQKMKDYRNSVLSKIKNHEVFDISYEKFAKEPNLYLKQIQSFLGVDAHDLVVKSVKKEKRPLSEVIVNYEELHQFFRESEWKYLFRSNLS